MRNDYLERNRNMRTSASRRGGIVWGLLITAAGLLCLAVVVGLAIARNIRVRTDTTRGGDHVLIETPAGNFNLQAHTAGKDLVDIPSYPGARHKDHSGGGAVFKWTSNDGREDKGLTVAGEEMITSDSVDDVVKFYRTQLPAWVLSHDRDGATHLKLEKGGQKRFVAISAQSDGTHIGVASIGEPASN